MKFRHRQIVKNSVRKPGLAKTFRGGTLGNATPAKGLLAGLANLGKYHLCTSETDAAAGGSVRGRSLLPIHPGKCKVG